MVWCGSVGEGVKEREREGGREIARERPSAVDIMCG